MTVLFETIVLTLIYAIGIYRWIVIGAIVFSWLFAFNVVNGRNQFVATLGQFFYARTAPALRHIRRVLPSMGAIDISPIVLFVALFFLEQLLWGFLR